MRLGIFVFFIPAEWQGNAFTPSRSSQRGGIAVDLEAEQHLLRVVDRVVFLEIVPNSRVNAIARNGEGLPIRTDVEHVIVECIRALEIRRLAECVCLRITEAGDFAQARIARQADGFDVRGRLRRANAVREFLYQREAVVRDKVRTSGAERATNDLEAIRGHRRICSKSYAKRHGGRRSADFAVAETPP